MGSILRLNRPKISSEIDVIQWDRIKSGKDPAVKLNKVFESPTEDNSNAETSDDPDIGRFLIQAIQFLNQAIQFLDQAIQFLIQAIQFFSIEMAKNANFFREIDSFNPFL